MVLGLDWLRNLSPTTFDFKDLTLQFIHEGKPIQLRGTTNRASLRVIDVELLEEITTLEVSWMDHLSSMQGKLQLNQFAALFGDYYSITVTSSRNLLSYQLRGHMTIRSLSSQIYSL